MFVDDRLGALVEVFVVGTVAVFVQAYSAGGCDGCVNVETICIGDLCVFLVGQKFYGVTDLVHFFLTRAC